MHPLGVELAPLVLRWSCAPIGLVEQLFQSLRLGITAVFGLGHCAKRPAQVQFEIFETTLEM